MPTYSYCCPSCGDIEIKHSIHADAPLACPACGAAQIKRRFQPIGVNFKGSGFYSTDSRGK